MQGPPRWPPSSSQLKLVELCEEAAEILAGGGEADVHVEDELPSRVAAVFTVRSARMLTAVATLCGAGLAVEAGPLVRCILEDLMSLAYMSLDPERHAGQWLTHGEDVSYKSLLRARELGYDMPDSERTRELEEAFADTKPRLWWASRAPSGMADAIKERFPEIYEDFLRTYDLLSWEVHGNVMGVEHYVVEVDGVVNLVVGPSNHLMDDRLHVAIHLARRVARLASELGVAVDIEALDRVASDVSALCPPETGE